MCIMCKNKRTCNSDEFTCESRRAFEILISRSCLLNTIRFAVIRLKYLSNVQNMCNELYSEQWAAHNKKNSTAVDNQANDKQLKSVAQRNATFSFEYTWWNVKF